MAGHSPERLNQRFPRAAIQSAKPDTKEAKFKEILDSLQKNFDALEEPSKKAETVLGFYLMSKNAPKLASMENKQAQEMSASFGGLTFHPERYATPEIKEKFLQNSSDQIFSTFDACKDAGDEVRFFNEGFSKACFEDSLSQLYMLNESVVKEQDLASVGADNPLKAAFALNQGVDQILEHAMEAANEYNPDTDGSFAEWASQKYGIPDSGLDIMRQVEEKLIEYGMI